MAPLQAALLVLLATVVGQAAAQVSRTCPPGHIWKDPQGCVCNAGGTITCGLGLCQVTIPACNSAGVANQCIPNDPPTPGVDVCNGKDDDCDGLIDEDDADKTVSCGTGVCQNTVKVCLNGEWTGGAWCYPRLEQKTKEVCDGLDNDCDGIVDNMGFITCGKGRCQRTVPVCTNGTLNECVPGAPRDEICDNLDNDCDGLVDEDLGHVLCPGVPGLRDVIYSCYEGRQTQCPEQCRIPDGPANTCRIPGTNETRCGRMPPVTGVYNASSGTWTVSHPEREDDPESQLYGRHTLPIPDTLQDCYCDADCWLRGDCCADVGPVCTPGDNEDLDSWADWISIPVDPRLPVGGDIGDNEHTHCIYCPQMLERYEFYLKYMVNNADDKVYVRSVYDAALRQLTCNPETLCPREIDNCQQYEPCVEDRSQCIPWLETIVFECSEGSQCGDRRR